MLTILYYVIVIPVKGHYSGLDFQLEFLRQVFFILLLHAAFVLVWFTGVSFFISSEASHHQVDSPSLTVSSLYRKQKLKVFFKGKETDFHLSCHKEQVQGAEGISELFLRFFYQHTYISMYKCIRSGSYLSWKSFPSFIFPLLLHR